MSEFNGRRAPNFSQYLDDLNAIPSPYDQALQQQHQDSYNLENELSLFTNAEFFDFDKFADLNLPNFDQLEDNTVKKETAQDTSSDMDFLNLLGGELLQSFFENTTIYNPWVQAGWLRATVGVLLKQLHTSCMCTASPVASTFSPRQCAFSIPSARQPPLSFFLCPICFDCANFVPSQGLVLVGEALLYP